MAGVLRSVGVMLVTARTVDLTVIKILPLLVL